MSDDDENSASVTVQRPEEEALRLKTLAEEKYNSGNLNSALNYAKRAHEVNPSVDGLSEMLIAFKILLAAAASPISDSSSATEKSTLDYYRILQVERFSHINSIKKQYKKLALILHPDKNPFAASEEAFKLVGEAAQVLSDKIRRKEYDMKLRIAMQTEAAEDVGLGPVGAEETFLTACSACRLSHQFERKYLGHNLMCRSCKKTFKAMKLEEGKNSGGDEGSMEEIEGIGEGQTRVSARIRERVAKGGNVGAVAKFGLGVKRKISSVGEDSQRPGAKLTRMKKVETVGKSFEGGGSGIEELKLKEVHLDNKDGGGAVKELRSRRVVGKVRDEVENALESGRTKKAEDSEEETMTLYQMQMMVKKKRKKQLVEDKSRKEREVNDNKLEAKGTEVEIEKIEEMEKERENMREEDGEKEREMEEEEEEKEKGNEIVNIREKPNRRTVSKDRKLEAADHHHSENVKDRSSKKGNLEVLLVEEDEKGKENEIENTREKRERRRNSKYGNLDFLKTNTSENQMDTEIEGLISSPNEKGNLEIMPVEDSDFYDFDRDRKERSFKKGQVWAVYDDDDGMPRHYGLIERVISVNPFQVTFIWLRFHSNKDEKLRSWPNTGCHVSCGIFQVSRKVTIKYLNLFSHLVDCERATKELYRIYPKKGSVWAMYNNTTPQTEEINQVVIKDIRWYDVVVSLSSYSDIHGLSIGYLEKVQGFRAVFKRKEIGANAVVCLGPRDVRLLSHQIPAKKLSGEESSNLPRDCWELDPASLTPQLLATS